MRRAYPEGCRRLQGVLALPGPTDRSDRVDLFLQVPFLVRALEAAMPSSGTGGAVA
ncbi:MAG TPA: hypothetical protein VED59_00740 [Acidimicrobiales bacterium]|nr:hypothetical protein [Acidimicrobiales bacterium]